MHNNFGICSLFSMDAKEEGSSRIKAFVRGHEGTNQSEKAEAVSYRDLHVVSTNYFDFFTNLHSKDQSDGEL